MQSELLLGQVEIENMLWYGFLGRWYQQSGTEIGSYDLYQTVRYGADDSTTGKFIA